MASSSNRDRTSGSVVTDSPCLHCHLLPHIRAFESANPTMHPAEMAGALATLAGEMLARATSTEGGLVSAIQIAGQVMTDAAMHDFNGGRPVTLQ